MRYELSPKRTLVVQGPASLTILTGQAQILGNPLTIGQRLVITEQKQFPIESGEGAELEIIIGKQGGLHEIQGSAVPSSWESAFSALAEMRKGSVIVLGPTDVGKSTLCVYLLNRLRSAGQDARIIDADIGQADIGPPTSIALSSPNRPITSLTELTPESMIFIGHTTPSYVEAKLIRGIGRLAVRAAPPITIINTDGWIAEREAISYKINLITQIQPQLVLGLGRSSELQPILEGVRSHILHVHAAENVLARSRADRKKLRAWRYRRFLEGGGITRTPFSNVRLSAPKNFPVVSPANSSALRNLMVGILDTSGFLTQIGILTDVESDAIRIYSRQRDAISRIELGFVKLTPSGREIGFI